jgi:hypothetical protein
MTPVDRDPGKFYDFFKCRHVVYPPFLADMFCDANFLDSAGEVDVAEEKSAQNFGCCRRYDSLRKASAR